MSDKRKESLAQFTAVARNRLQVIMCVLEELESGHDRIVVERALEVLRLEARALEGLAVAVGVRLGCPR